MSDLNLRRIGPSDYPALVGADKFGSPFALWARIKGLGEPERDAGLEQAARWGRHLEPGIWSMFAEDEGLDVDAVVRGVSREHGAREFLRYTPDVLVPGTTPRNIQIKTIFAYRHEAEDWGDEGGDGVPDRIRMQVTGEIEALKSEPAFWEPLGIDVTKIDYADVVTMKHGDGPLRLLSYRVPYVPALGAMLLDEAERFWRDNIVGGKQPDVDASERCEAVLKMLHRKGNGEVVIAGPEDDEAALDYRRGLDMENEAKALKLLATNRLRARIGGADGIKGVNWSVSYSQVKGSTDWERVAKAIARDHKLSDETLDRYCADCQGGGYRSLKPNLRKLVA